MGGIFVVARENKAARENKSLCLHVSRLYMAKYLASAQNILARETSQHLLQGTG